MERRVQFHKPRERQPLGCLIFLTALQKNICLGMLLVPLHTDEHSSFEAPRSSLTH